MSAGNGERHGADDERVVHEADPNDSTVCTWDELRRMRASGLVDVESHSASALSSVHRSPHDRLSDGAELAHCIGCGFVVAPEMIEISAAATGLVSVEYRRRAGDVSRARLRELSRAHSEDAFRMLEPDEVACAIREDLAASQGAFRAGLRDPAAGSHLCLPYTEGSDVALEAARALAFRSVFCGVTLVAGSISRARIHFAPCA